MDKQKKPQIRFAGFTDDWEQRKVSAIFKVTRGYVLAATQTDETSSPEKPYPVYSSQTKDYGLMGYHTDYLYEDAITWTTDGANAGTVRYRGGKFYCTNVCGVLLANKVTPNHMVAEALNNVAKHYVSYVGNPKLMNNVMSDIEILLPTQELERIRMSDFFTNFDNLITFHQRKYDKLLNVKRSMLQKMFPKDSEIVPEIRFKGFTEAWEQFKLDTFGKATAGTSIESEFIDSGKYKVISIGSYSESSKYTDQGIRANSTNKTIQRVLNKNDLTMILNDKTSSGNIIGRVLLIDADDSYVYNQRTERIEVDESLFEPRFIYQLLNADNVRSKIIKASQGNTQIYVNWSSIKELSYTIPSSKGEQRKIADYFENIDNLLTLQQRELEKLQSIKKALLEKMFV